MGMSNTIQQLSVFLENREGRLDEVLTVLADNGVNIVALSLADTSDYGMLRMIVSDPQRGKQALKEAGITAMLTDVVALRVPHATGSLSRAMHQIVEGEVNVEYMYAFVGNRQDGHAVVVMRTDNEEIAQQALDTHHISTYPPRYLPFITPLPLRWRRRSLPLAAGGFFSVLDRSRRFLYNIIRRYQETIFQRGANPCPKNQWSP